MKKVNYEFSEDELTLAEKVLTNLESRLIRDKKRYPEAPLWLSQPSLFADVSKIKTAIGNKSEAIAIPVPIVRLVKRTIEHLLVVHTEKWLKALYSTEQQMKRLHYKLVKAIK